MIVLARVDPANTALRWGIVVSRRQYSVPQPNALWHLDGHHSLIRWGLVINPWVDRWFFQTNYVPQMQYMPEGDCTPLSTCCRSGVSRKQLINFLFQSGVHCYHLQKNLVKEGSSTFFLIKHNSGKV